MSSVPIIFVLGFSMYMVMPVVIVWGWLRWKKRTQPRNVFSTLSLIGFTFATASGLLAVFSIAYAIAFRFRFYDPTLLKIFGLGFLLSLVGFLFAVCGAWRPNPLRWHAPAGAAGMCLFWFVAALGE